MANLLYFSNNSNEITPEYRYNLVTKLAITPDEHYHDFFEIFLTTNGNITHFINGEKQKLPEGALVFIRPEDRHFYERNMNSQCAFINLSFAQTTLKAAFDYLGGWYSLEALLNPKLPPLIILSKADKLMLKSKLDNLAAIPQSEKLKAKSALRIFLIELLTQYFYILNYNKKDIPIWLEILHHEMQKVENFTEGVIKMQSLSGRNSDYLSRAFNKYYHTTPTEFINGLRLNYAANLLMYSNESILSIMLSAGFNNLSYFYHIFNNEFKTTPLKFRKLYAVNSMM